MTPKTKQQGGEMKFPEHKCELTLTHNSHKNYYEPIEEYLTRPQFEDLTTWATDTSKERILKTDEIWELQWYPDTPIGFYLVVGATLEEVLQKANN